MLPDGLLFSSRAQTSHLTSVGMIRLRSAGPVEISSAADSSETFSTATSLNLKTFLMPSLLAFKRLNDGR
jgi:hypothetical protein